MLDFSSMNDLAVAYGVWIEESLKEGSHFRDERWTESVAVGGEAFVTATKAKLGFKAKAREVLWGNGSFELRESLSPYTGISRHENAVVRARQKIASQIWRSDLG